MAFQITFLFVPYIKTVCEQRGKADIFLRKTKVTQISLLLFLFFNLTFGCPKFYKNETFQLLFECERFDNGVNGTIKNINTACLLCFTLSLIHI